MDREYSQEDTNFKHAETEEQGIVENLKFIRSVIDKTCRKVNPGWPILIGWGLVIMIGFPLAYYIKIRQLDAWKWPVYFVLLVISLSIAIYFGAKATMREKKAGLIPYLSRQIYLIWFILIANGAIWTCLGLFKDHIGGFGFLWTAIYGIALSMMGLLYSREWLCGGIAIFVGIIAACFTDAYAYVILGIVTGLAFIIPAVIAQSNYRKQEKENA